MNEIRVWNTDGMIMTRENGSPQCKICPIDSSSTTWNALISNLGLHCERLARNILSHMTVKETGSPIMSLLP